MSLHILLLAMGLPKVYVNINVLRFIVTAIVMSCAAQFDLIPLGIGFAFVSILMMPVYFFVVRLLAAVPVLAILRAYLPIAFAGSVMAAMVMGVGTLGGGAGTVLTQIAVGIVTYSGLLFLIAPQRVQAALVMLMNSSLLRPLASWFSGGKHGDSPRLSPRRLTQPFTNQISVRAAQKTELQNGTVSKL